MTAACQAIVAVAVAGWMPVHVCVDVLGANLAAIGRTVTRVLEHDLRII